MTSSGICGSDLRFYEGANESRARPHHRLRTTRHPRRGRPRQGDGEERRPRHDVRANQLRLLRDVQTRLQRALPDRERRQSRRRPRLSLDGPYAGAQALLRGASCVYVVDHLEDRLRIAEDLGAIPIDYGKGDPVEQIFEHRGKVRGRAGRAWRGEDPLRGVSCVLECVGADSADRMFSDIGRVVNPSGRIAIIGVFPHKDLVAPEGSAHREGRYLVPLGDLFAKSVRIGIDRGPEAYKNFEARKKATPKSSSTPPKNSLSS